jgi:hypothetical protein
VLVSVENFSAVCCYRERRERIGATRCFFQERESCLALRHEVGLEENIREALVLSLCCSLRRARLLVRAGRNFNHKKYFFG